MKLDNIVYILLSIVLILISVVKHYKCYFYILYEDKVYLYVVKAPDFDNDKLSR